MPSQTIVRSQFAEAVREAMGGLTPNVASYKTGVSDEWIRKMSHGRVPSEAILKRFADGLGADLRKLMVAADYTETTSAPSEVHEPKTEYLTFSADATNERLERLEKEVSGLRADLDRIVGMFRNMAGIVKGRVGEKEQEDRHG